MGLRVYSLISFFKDLFDSFERWALGMFSIYNSKDYPSSHFYLPEAAKCQTV